MYRRERKGLALGSPPIDLKSVWKYESIEHFNISSPNIHVHVDTSGRMNNSEF
jgi:hypothetical protein